MGRGKKILCPIYVREDDENKIPRNYQERVISDIEGFFVLLYSISDCWPIILLFIVNKYKELFILLYRIIILNSYLKLVTKRALC